MESLPPSTAPGTFGLSSDKNLIVRAHHSDGITRVIHSPHFHHPKDGSSLVDRLFSGGDDYLVRIISAEEDSNVEPIMLDEAIKPITWLDIDEDYLVVSSEDGCVRIYEYKVIIENGNTDFTSTATDPIILTRCPLPVRCSALERFVENQKTPRIAVCSDDLVVKVIDAADPKRVQLLTGHNRGVRSASWSPSNPLLVTSSSDGTVMVWDLSTTEPKCIQTLTGIIAPSRDNSELNVEAIWHPSGDLFLLASKTHEIVICSAQSQWRPVDADMVIDDESSINSPRGDISFMAFSPNGLYLAVSTTDGQLIIWDWNSRRALCSNMASALVTGISWNPTKDALAWTDNKGQLTRWKKVIGEGRQSAFDMSVLEQHGARRKRQIETDSLFDAGMDDDIMELEHDEPVDDLYSHKRASKKVRMSHRSNYTPMVPETRAQSSFQPASTPMRNSRKYLAFNPIGLLVTIDQGSHQSISFESFDAGARRNWRFVDHFGYNMASIGVHGALMACPERNGTDSFDGTDNDFDEEGNERDRGHASNVHFKPFEAPGGWSIPGSEWSIDLPRGENVVALAMAGRRSMQQTSLDSCTAIVATTEGYLRFFSGAGLQRYVWAFGSQVITLAAGNRFALIIHRNSGAEKDHQNMLYTLIDVRSLEIRQEGVLPLVKDATLHWLGFSEMDVPAIYDSRGVLYFLDRALSMPGQARWTPALDTRQIKKDGRRFIEDSVNRMQYWPVGLDGNNLLAVMLKGQSYPDPSASSRPLIQELPLSIPVIQQAGSIGPLEEQVLRQNQLSAHARAFRASLLQDEEEDEYYGDLLDQPLAKPNPMEHEADKALLQLIQLACKSDQHQRALDAARELHTGRTLEAALQIGAFFHQSSLIDRMNSLRGYISERRERDERTLGGIPFTSAMNNLTGDLTAEATSRVLVASSPAPAKTNGSDRARAKQALKSDFNFKAGQTSFGSGRRSELAKIGQSPSSTWAKNGAAQSSPSSTDNNTAREVVEVDDDTQLLDEDPSPSEQGSPILSRRTERDTELVTNSATTSPFTNKTNRGFAKPQASVTSKAAAPIAKNPFARTAGMTRDKSMHKSNSFFDRVENVTQQAASLPSSAAGPKKAAKQTTLFGITRTNKSVSNIPTITSSSEAIVAPAATPAFGEIESQQTDEGFGSEESLRLTLDTARQRDNESQIRLEETQAMIGEEEESQGFENDHHRIPSSSIPVS